MSSRINLEALIKSWYYLRIILLVDTFLMQHFSYLYIFILEKLSLIIELFKLTVVMLFFINLTCDSK